MRIIHFSDIHVGCCPREVSALVDKRVLGALNHFLRRRTLFHLELLPRALARIRALAPDWVVCTGDITCVGSPREFDKALSMLQPLLRKPCFRMAFVPGNHDAYVRRQTCRQALEHAFGALNTEGWQLADRAHEVRMHDLRLFFVDETLPTNWLLSSGRLADETQARLAGWLDSARAPGEKRVLIGHYPLRDDAGRPLGRRRHLEGSALLERALEDGRLDVNLCGHVHRPYVRKIGARAMEICAGSLTASGLFNVLDYHADKGSFEQFWVDVNEHRPVPPALVESLAPALFE